VDGREFIGAVGLSLLAAPLTPRRSRRDDLPARMLFATLPPLDQRTATTLTFTSSLELGYIEARPAGWFPGSPETIP
jgi:hypothetical protein